MKATFDIADYLTPDQIEGLVDSAATEYLTRYLEDEQTRTRLFDNAVYFTVQRLINLIFKGDESLGDALEQAVKEQIQNKNTIGFNMFQKADAWDRRQGRTDSVGQELLEEATRKARPQIENRVNEIIKDLSYNDVRELIIDAVASSIPMRGDCPEN